MSEVSLEDAQTRARASALVEWLVRNQQLIDNQLTSSSAWLSGSLLALNSGGAIALSQLVDRVEHPRVALGLLLAGIAFALLSPVIIQAYASRTSPIVGRRIIFWAGVVAGESVDEAADEDFVSQLARYDWMSLASPACGWVSALLFIGAVLTVALGFDVDSTANDKRCEAVQKDMLSAKPLRTDSVRLFEVLGCKPAGSGSVHAAR